MTNWILIIEIIWHSNANYYTYKINNRELKCPFVSISNVPLIWILDFNIENRQDCQICNKGQFEARANAQDCALLTNNAQQRPIWIHRKRTGTHMNAQKHTGVRGVTQEGRIMTNKVHHKRPINSRTSIYLPYAVVVADTIFFMMLLRILFE